ncbi:NDMA-dependent alcohol dehydrogenase [Mycobacterium vicinigordonae]|uniref:alcohol dehydrogenase n=1 Tax=Mycobacterium vicinigordonae TaxID=1719132 RepID=A0A7D6DWB1_9MYCO|nr:NDMA-dependent alcohol dehydrogenase [Mycobacterium vicinigordonae]QLL06364.1 NDMA-dependent alcohol dehydrogenase [Mycobacterium vicinigordonae]
MKTNAAILHSVPGQWSIEAVDLADPQEGQLQVEMRCAGLCHSDYHQLKGEIVPPVFPWCGGHEGSGVVEKVGPGVLGFSVGDHVALSFIPSCGTCRWCAEGMQNLCDSGASIMSMNQDRSPMSLNGTPVAQTALVGAFSEHVVVPVESCVKITSDIPFGPAALVTCGVPTGWGSAVNGAAVAPGDVVIVMGIGGIGINAVQGARYVGASHVIAVDPVAFKRDTALKLGANHAFATMDEATELARTLTNGQGADATIVTVGVLESEDIAVAFSSIRKAGTVVVTALGDMTTMNIPVNLAELTLFQKRIQGCLYGMMSPRSAVPRLLQLYQTGDLHLDELITREYTLDEINDAYHDLGEGKIIRGVVRFGGR